ncbi:ABC-type Fe3+-hydroxamate transport system substrate-binding protein [Desulfohalotomaculum tongense]|uniref:DUF1657 domain-containing protein n=1 Tax=Desulforadius tongensis TaxID=1216062 RepID=UPI00195E4D03|nr:DUF1657 domain-containing protein [Desulforadius tongensis]MBM7855302.1 ABC-type Fe3+-hydroxamate transport system substrate-binding protein [Desulforadius tongensis]
MTVASHVKQTLASLKGTQAALKNMAAVEQEEQAQKLLKNSADKLEYIIEDFQHRLKTLEFEEPQYKGF